MITLTPYCFLIGNSIFHCHNRSPVPAIGNEGNIGKSRLNGKHPYLFFFGGGCLHFTWELHTWIKDFIFALFFARGTKGKFGNQFKELYPKNWSFYSYLQNHLEYFLSQIHLECFVQFVLYHLRPYLFICKFLFPKFRIVQSEGKGKWYYYMVPARPTKKNCNNISLEVYSSIK